MLSILVAAVLSGPSVTELDALAKRRDSEALARFVSLKPGSKNPFQVIQIGGAYGVGRFGWSAIDLPATNGVDDYVVFSTPLTVEDTGELLFRRQGDQLE